MDIKELKERITILEVADKLQITVDKQVKALCPFHDDIKVQACSSAKKRTSALALAPNALLAPWILLGLLRRN
jgi:hypothetical protein